jgi:methyl-accepting chemotaxis protein
MTLNQDKRKTVLTDIKFQIGIAFKLGLFNVLGIMCLTFWFIILTQDYISNLYLKYNIPLANTSKVFIFNNVPIIIGYLIAILLFIFLGSIVSIRLTHKITGPIFRINREIKKIRSGDLRRNLELRSIDYGKDLAESVEGLQNDLKIRITEIFQEVEELNELTKDINAFLKKDTATELQYFHSRTVMIKQKLEFFHIKEDNIR